ncbi:MAG: DUF924 domain-containing protein [Sneathiella sp.]|nr:DUF924 domain-containing protein [Sneathiella sp.]
MQRIQYILDFWFHPKNHVRYGEKRVEWFEKNTEFDEIIRQEFFDDFVLAEKGKYLQWSDHAEGCLALILLFDQFSRNMFREDARAFSTDGKAREIARHMIRSGCFSRLQNFQKTFAILPFEHSEDLEDQILSVKLCKEFCNKEEIRYAEQHFDIIKKFNRFPHRNKILERKSTLAEIEFLTQPNSSF